MISAENGSLLYIAGLTNSLLLLLVVSGCAARGGSEDDAECSPVESRLPAGSTAEGLAGQYRLTLVATRGERSGNTVQGRLWLHEQQSELRSITMPGGGPIPNATMPLYGATDTDLDAVGALRLGDPMSLDPMSPGVAVLEQRGSEKDAHTEITLRLGSAANRRDVQAFDVGFTALYVHRIEEGRVGGAWASGVIGRESEGYFCAVGITE